MKRYKKKISVVLLIVLLLCSMPILVTANTIMIAVDSVNVNAGKTGRIAITTDNFDGFVGGFNFEIKFPQIATITNVYLGENILTSFSNGGNDYTINSENTLILIGTCNYGDDTVLDDNTSYYVEFEVSKDAERGEYPVEITKDTAVVSADNSKDFIFLNKKDGKITVIESRFLKADIDENGNVDEADITLLRKRLLGMDVGGVFNETSADMNDDGTLDILDMVAWHNYFGNSVVYLSDNGNDNNAGYSKDLPVATLNQAIEQVSDGGTIFITDTYTVDNSFSWSKHNKSVNISGGTIDATSVSTFKIADDTTFMEGTTLKFKSGAEIYADGYSLKISENVDVSGKPYLYGGGSSDVKSTLLEVYSGSYKRIFGGGNNADVAENTNVIIGGKVNSNLDETDHYGDVRVYGGGNFGVVNGNTNITVQDEAKATYIYGAGYGSDSNVKGKTNVNILGGAFVGAYAGSEFGKCSGTQVNLHGGKIEQIFGGSEGNVIIGDTRVNILGGTVTRRIYGGCYNEYSIVSGWKTKFHVDGNTTVFLSANATIEFDSQDDKGIFACTRYGSHYDDENSTIIFEDSAAKTKFEGLLGQQDGWLQNSWCAAAKNQTILN